MVPVGVAVPEAVIAVAFFHLGKERDVNPFPSNLVHPPRTYSRFGKCTVGSTVIYSQLWIITFKKPKG